MLRRLQRGDTRAGETDCTDDLHGGRRDVLKFAGHRIDARGEFAKLVDVIIRGGCGCRRDGTGRAAVGVGSVDMCGDSKLCRGDSDHAAKLATAKDADALVAGVCAFCGHDGVSATESVCACRQL